VGYWYVVGCVLTSSLLLVWLRRFRLPVLSLVTANYFVAVGAAITYRPLRIEAFLDLSFVGWAGLIGLGVLFILVFALTGYVAREIGVSLAGMLSKLSLVIPIGFAVVFLREPLAPKQRIGLGLAILAIGLVHAPYLQEGGWQRLWRFLRWGLLLWLGNGVIDTLFKAMQPFWAAIPAENIPVVIMGSAGLIGLVLHFAQKQGQRLLSGRVWTGALVLGLTNIASVIFYLWGLRALPAVSFFLSLNLGIVLLSGGIGVLFFRERFSWLVGMGYGAGLGAIALLAT